MARTRIPENLKKRCRHDRRDWPTCGCPWHLAYNFRGREYRLSLHREAGLSPTESMTAGEARDWRDRLVKEIRDGKRDKPAAADLTFGDVCDKYVKAYVETPQRRKTAKRHFLHALTAWRQAVVTGANAQRVRLETLPISKLAKAHVSEIVEAKRTAAREQAERWQAAQQLPEKERPAGLRAPTAKLGEVVLNRHLARLRHLLNWCVGEGYLDQTPFRRGGVVVVKLNGSAEAPRDRRLSADEEQALLAAASPHLRAFVTAMLETGCRPGELLNLRVQDVDLNAGLIALKGERTKTSRPRAIPITARLRAVLEMRQFGPDGDKLAPTGYLFGEAGRKVTSLKTAWGNACRRAGLTDLHPHNLRREFASRLMESSVEMHLTRDWLGHANVSTTSRYLATTIAGLQAAAKRFEAANRTNDRTQAEAQPQPDTATSVEVPTIQ